MTTHREILNIALWIAIAILVAAVIPIWPYGLYTLLRLVVTGTALYSLFVLGASDPRRTVGLILVAVLFNPLFPVHLTRVIWLPIDLGVAFWFWRLRGISDGS
ncbi:MAG TPA: hypothetical protein EYQ60_17910 [Myxococcales bacterium]|nr:hypothetical protein [Myxococcales bacterium]